MAQAWSFLGAGAVATGTNPTASVPSGILANDFMILVVGSTSTVSTPSGWTLQASRTTSPTCYIFTKVATGSETTVAITASATQTAAVIVAYRYTTGAIDVQSTVVNNGNTTTANTTSITTTAADDAVISIWTTEAASRTYTAPSGTTTRVLQNSSSTCGIVIVDEDQATAGATTQRTITWGGGNTNVNSYAMAVFNQTGLGNFFFPIGRLM